MYISIIVGDKGAYLTDSSAGHILREETNSRSFENLFFKLHLYGENMQRSKDSARSCYIGIIIYKKGLQFEYFSYAWTGMGSGQNDFSTVVWRLV